MADKKISQLTSATTPLAGTEELPIVQSGSTVKTTVAGVTKDRTGISVGKALNSWRTTSPDYVVQVGDTAAVFSDSNVTLDLGNNWYLNSSNQYIRNITNGATRVQCYQGNYKFFTAASGSAGTQITWRQDFTITQSSGDVTVNTGNLIQGTAAKGVNFTANTPAAGMTSQLLNWYEEGTWTPAFAPSSGAFGSVTYNAIRGARYTRIGNVVHVQGAIATDAITVGTAANNVWITGLPFTAVANTGSTNNGFSDISIGYSSNFAVNVPSHGYVTAGTTRLELYYRLTANGASTSLNVTDLSTTDKNYIYFSAAYICA